MNIADERNIDPVSEMRRIADNLLRLGSQGFKLSYQNEKIARLIYESEFCKVRLHWNGWDAGVGNSMYIQYGRLHAANDVDRMIWQEEECRCWHRVEYPLYFLDKRMPLEVIKLRLSHPVIDPFYQTEITEKFERRQPEWLAEMHLTIWKYYGQRLFDLFDVRRPDLWQQYQQFLRDVCDAQREGPRYFLPADKVC